MYSIPGTVYIIPSLLPDLKISNFVISVTLGPNTVIFWYCTSTGYIITTSFLRVALYNRVRVATVVLVNIFTLPLSIKNYIPGTVVFIYSNISVVLPVLYPGSGVVLLYLHMNVPDTINTCNVHACIHW